MAGEEYSVRFNSNLSEFTTQSIELLNRFIQQVEQVGGRLDSIDFGSEMFRGVTGGLEGVAEQVRNAMRSATSGVGQEFANSINRQLADAKLQMESSAGGERVGPGITTPTVGAQGEEQARQIAADSERVLLETMRRIPPELREALAGPITELIRAIGMEGIDSVRASVAALRAEARKSMPAEEYQTAFGAPLNVRSSVQQVRDMQAPQLAAGDYNAEASSAVAKFVTGQQVALQDVESFGEQAALAAALLRRLGDTVTRINTNLLEDSVTGQRFRIDRGIDPESKERGVPRAQPVTAAGSQLAAGEADYLAAWQAAIQENAQIDRQRAEAKRQLVAEEKQIYQQYLDDQRRYDEQLKQSAFGQLGSVDAQGNPLARRVGSQFSMETSGDGGARYLPTGRYVDDESPEIQQKFTEALKAEAERVQAIANIEAQQLALVEEQAARQRVINDLLDQRVKRLGTSNYVQYDSGDIGSLKTGQVGSMSGFSDEERLAIARGRGDLQAEPPGAGSAFFKGLMGGHVGGEGISPFAQSIGSVGQMFRWSAGYGAVGAALGMGTSSISDVVQQSRATGDLNEQLQGLQNAQVNVATATQGATAAGISQNDAINAGTAAIGAFKTQILAGADANEVFATSLKAAGEAAVLTGQDVATSQQQLLAATNAFQTGYQGQSRILDATQNAYKAFGGDRGQILQGLAAGGDVAQQAGIDPNQYANMIALVQSRTGQSGGTVASSLDRVLARGSNQQFEGLVSQMGGDTLAPINQQIQYLADHYQALSASGKQAFDNMLGGARNLRTILPIITNYNDVLKATADSEKNSGSAAEAYYKRINDLVGTLKQIGATIKDVFQQLGESGVLAPLGAMIMAIKPVIDAIDSLLRMFNAIPGGIRDSLFAVGELILAMRLLGKVTAESSAGNMLNKASRGRLFGDGADKASTATKTEESAATTEQAAAEEKLAATKAAAADATTAETAATTAATEAKGAEAAAIANVNRLLMEQNGLIAENTAEETANTAEKGLNGEAGFLSSMKTGGGRMLDMLGGWKGVGMIGGTLALSEGISLASGERQASAGDMTASHTAASGATTVQGMRDAASTMADAAKTQKEQADRLFGLGGILTGASGAQHTDQLASDQYNAMADRLNSYLQTHVGPETIDMTAPDAVKNQITAMQNAGMSASEVFHNLSDAMDNAANNAIRLQNHLPGQVLPGQGVQAGFDVGSAVSSALTDPKGQVQKDLNTYFSHGMSSDTRKHEGWWSRNVWDNLPWSSHAPTAGNLLTRGVDTKQVENQIRAGDIGQKTADAFTQEYNSVGLDKGGVITPDDRKKIEDKVRAAAIAQLSQIKDLPKDIRDHIVKTYVDAADKEMDTLSGKGGNNAPIDRSNFATYAQTMMGYTPTLGQEAATAILQSGTDGNPVASPDQVAYGTGSNLTMIAGTADTQNWKTQIDEYNSLIEQGRKLGFSDEDMRGLIDARNNAQIQYRQSIQTDADSLNSLATAMMDPLDSTGKLQKQYDDLQKKIEMEPDGPQKNADLATAATQAQQLQAKHLQDQAAAVTAAANPLDQVSEADAAYTNAQNALKDANDRLAKLNQADQDRIKKGSDYLALVTANDQAQASDINAHMQQYQQYAQGMVATGDIVGAAYAQLLTANQQLTVDKGGTFTIDGKTYTGVKAASSEKTAADTQAQANSQLGVDLAHNQSEDLAVRVKIDPRNTLALDQQAVTLAQNNLNTANAHHATQDEINTLQLALTQAQITQTNDTVTQQNQQRDAQASSLSTVQTAQAALDDANNTFNALSKNDAGYWQAYKDVQDKKHALAVANQQAADVAHQLTIDITNPITMAADAVDQARRTLALDKSEKQPQDVIDKDTLAVRQATNSAEKTTIDTKLSDAQMQLQLHHISGAQYIQMLQNLRATITGNSYQEQQLRNEIDSAIQSQNQQLQGQFNLGTIQMPTIYEVRRQVAAQQGNVIDASTTNNNVQINGVDFAKVVTYIQQVLGPGASRVASARRLPGA